MRGTDRREVKLALSGAEGWQSPGGWQHTLSGIRIPARRLPTLQFILSPVEGLAVTLFKRHYQFMRLAKR
ncbi:hypothetical protein LS482_11685 [Sinomicrobium kalidii]|uniref:hypothetical protein n=1 Tax=Sinomicrobium kalidii TaxID=2900738 RepID=UPI001E384CDE|nr:hypothetical protein [Sinomicrobium kalidii]UGU14369.1 hypothetical protein LS482_11685 [Sinomicrobium kalidii]